MKRTSDAAAVLALALTALPTLASAPRPAATTDAPVARQLASPARSGWAQVIVKTDSPLSADQRARMTRLGANITRDLPIIGSLALRVPARNLAALAALPFITHLSSDGTVEKCDEFTVGSSGAGAALTQYGVDGTGVTVAVLDSGIHACLDFNDSANVKSRVVQGVSFVAGNPSLEDSCGHGTHIAGIIAGNGYASSKIAYAYGYTPSSFSHTFYGVARNSNLVNVRVLDSSGQGTVSTVVSGIQWVVNNKTALKIRVLNLSLGHSVGESYTTDPLCQAVEQAWKAGIVVVCAAGNNGRLNSVNTAGAPNEGWGTAYGSIASPGNDPYVITVGATKNIDGNRADDRAATYSSRGPSRLDLVCKPDILAPGNQVISTSSPKSNLVASYGGTNKIPWGSYCTVTNTRFSAAASSNCYFKLSGTSMATPVVAGAAALLLQKDPTLSPDTVKARLMLSADKLANWVDAQGNYDACTVGAGYLNIPAAIANTTCITGEYAISPSLYVDAGGNVLVSQDHALWGKSGVTSSHALWGSNALWGNAGLTDLHAIWGSHALWGTGTLASSHALWGTSVWSDHALWGSSTGAVDLSSVVIGGE